MWKELVADVAETPVEATQDIEGVAEPLLAMSWALCAVLMGRGADDYEVPREREGGYTIREKERPR